MKQLQVVTAILIIVGVAGLFALNFVNLSTPEIQSTVSKFSSFEELSNYLKENADTSSGFGNIFRSQMEAASTAAPQSDAGSKSIDYSSTNIQVSGVDEADIVKTDGKYIYTISNDYTNYGINIVDAYPPENAKIISRINLSEYPQDIFVNDGKLVVFGQRYGYSIFKSSPLMEGEIFPSYEPSVFIYVYDISNKENPVLVKNITLEGGYANSRMIDDYVYIVVNTPINLDRIALPQIQEDDKVKEIPAEEISYTIYPDYSYQYTEIISINLANNEVSEETILMGTSQNIFVSSNNIYITHAKPYNYYDYMDRVVDELIVSNLPASTRSEINEIRDSDLPKYEIYYNVSFVISEYFQSLSGNQEEIERWEDILTTKGPEVVEKISKEFDKTIIHRIEINNGELTYKSSGEVPGQVLNQFSMDEYNDHFRIATTTNNFGGFWGFPIATAVIENQVDVETIGSVRQGIKPQSSESNPGDPDATNEEPIEPSISEPRTPPIDFIIPSRDVSSVNNVYVLNMDMKIVGKIEDLAKGERIYSTRFLGDKGYMVTFRQIDPLFVIDLKHPADPKILGYLKIPGVSDYLHPYDENHVIGIGRDATEEGMITGMKLSLFDVSDVANPKEISKLIIGGRGTYSEALYNHKAFLFSKEKNLLVLPISVYENYFQNSQGAYIFSVDLENGFKQRGIISHSTGEDVFGNAYVSRSLFIEDVLYTISQKFVKANNLSDLSEIKSIKLD